MIIWADQLVAGLAVDQSDALQTLFGKCHSIQKTFINRVLKLRFCAYKKYLKMSYFLADFAKYPAFFIKGHVVGTGINTQINITY